MWGIRGGLKGVGALAAVAATLVLAGSAGGADGLVPNDPYYPQQWAQRVLDMPELWKYTTGDPNVIIAMVDTGTDYGIADLQGQFTEGWDIVDNDPVPQDTSYGGHGTRVSTIIGAKGNNAAFTAGYCWGCKLMPIRVSPDGKGNGSLIAAGIRWAVDRGARLITVGFNADIENFEERAAIRYAREKNALVIASAGNTGKAELRYPASFPGALAVAATDDADRLYFWSTRGSWVSLAAPGCQMVIEASLGPATDCGTSYTPAAVAGIAGLLLSLKPSLTDDELVQLLVSTAKPVDGIGGGRIDPVAAVRALGIPEPTPPAAAPPATTAPAAKASTPAARAAALVRTLSLRSGVMRSRITRTVRVGRGRLEVHFSASRAAECQIMVAAPKGEFILSLLPPVDATLRSLSEIVGPGLHRVEVQCDPGRRRSYQLSISAQPPPKPKS